MAAKALLDTIRKESASEFLQSVRYYTSPPGHTFFAPLDKILENYDPRAGEDSTLNRGDVIEIQGPAASGKTQILHFFAMTTALPSTWNVALTVRGSSRPPRLEHIAIGGRAKAVAVVDCDGRFSIERTYQLIFAHLARRVQEHAATIPALYSAEASPDALHEETLRTLSRVIVFTPSSSTALAATLLQLPVYVQKAASAELTFLLVDNISAFYWQDRYQGEQPAGSSKAKTRGDFGSMRTVTAAIGKVRKKLGLVTVLTNWAFPNLGDGQPSIESPFYRQHLPRPYPTPFQTQSGGTLNHVFNHSYPLAGSNTIHITHHITLHPPMTKHASQKATATDLMKEEPFRTMEQQELGSMAFVRIPGVENGQELGRWELVVRHNVVDGL